MSAIEPQTLNITAGPGLAGSATGFVTTDFGNGQDYGYAVAIQADGKILAAGSNGKSIALARYNPDGNLDTSFSDDGQLTTVLGYGYGLALQPDGKILVSGGNSNGFTLARYNSDGSLDSGFSGDGKLTTGFAFENAGMGVALQADGKILVAGYSLFLNINLDGDFALARYNADGSLDESFSEDGRLTTDFGGSEQGMSVVQQPDGKIVLAGKSLNSAHKMSFVLARYNLDGSLDESFSGDGKLSTSLDVWGWDKGESIALQPDGKILVAGSNINGFALVRYNPDGNLDPSFSGDGWLTTNLRSYSVGWSVALQPDGKIIVAGDSYKDSYSGWGFAMTRYNPDGSLDESFSADGMLTTDFGRTAWGKDVVLQPDGKIVVVGYISNENTNNDFIVARYTADGSLDTTFGNHMLSGSPTAQLPAGKEGAAYILQASDLLQGFTDPDGDTLSVSQLAATRYGKLKFSADGTWTFIPKAGYHGTVKLTYSVDDGRGGSLAATQSFILAAANDAPTVAAATFRLAENSLSGKVVGQAQGRDADGDALDYRLTGGNADWDGDGQPAFAINAKTGAIAVNDSDDLDFEAHPVFALDVTASDAGGLSGKATLTVKLSNLNEVLGTSGPDALRGTVGDDWLNGLAGDDSFAGGSGNDSLLGGAGNDRADFSGSLAPVAVDLAIGKATGQGADALASIESVTGGFAGDALIGDANANILWGGPGGDSLEGAGGGDRLGGGLGKDTLNGGDGDDLLYGGRGQDTLTGGAGADRFLYKDILDTGNTAATRDLVVDFSRADGDKLDLSLLDANPAQAGIQPWRFAAHFSGQAGQLSFDAGSHLVLFDRDGDKHADLAIELAGVAPLAGGDFVLA